MRFLVLAALAASPALAQDFSEGSEARGWNVFGEKKARFEATVSDALCAVTGDCPADCGGGLRQMVLIRTADGVQVLVAKNGEPVFSGAPADLAPFCNKAVEVDGLMVGDPEITPDLKAQVFQIQRIREVGGDWQKADAFTKDWAARNPGAEGKGPWFRRDPRINALIAETGYLGLGLETDAKFIEENY